MNHVSVSRVLGLALMLVLVAACGGAAVASPPVVAPSAPPASVAAPTEPPAPSVAASPEAPTEEPTEEPSVEALCMDPEIVEIIENDLGKLDELPADKVAAVVAALKAYDDPRSAEFREEMVGFIEAKDWFAVSSGMTYIASGQLNLQECPG